MPFSTRTFGIELELYVPRGKTREQLASAITAAGILCRTEGYGHSVPNQWKIVTDGSLGDYERGSEIVSPILRGDDGLRQARKVAEVALAFGCEVRKETGFHVHIFAGDLSADQMRSLFLNFVWFEDFFDHIMPPSRRASLNTYVASNRARMGRGYGTDAVNDWFGRLRTQTTVESLIVDFVGLNRYFKLNPTAYIRQKTVEFRQHSGTIDGDKIVNWVKLLMSFFEKSMVSKPRPRTVTRDLTAAEEMARFFAYIPCEPDLRAYYAERRRALHRDEKKQARVETLELAPVLQEAADLRERLVARRERVLHFARPQRRVSEALANALAILDRSINGPVPNNVASRAQHVRNTIGHVRALNLLPETGPNATA